MNARRKHASRSTTVDLWAEVRSFANLHAAGRAARLGKRNRTSVARYSMHLEDELFALQASLDDGRYRHGADRQFTLCERKPRLISAAPFADRLVHHALIRVVEPLIDPQVIPHSHACRRGKGVHAAVDHYQRVAGRFTYVMKMDIASYFPTIFQCVLEA